MQLTQSKIINKKINEEKKAESNNQKENTIQVTPHMIIIIFIVYLHFAINLFLMKIYLIIIYNPNLKTLNHNIFQ